MLHRAAPLRWPLTWLMTCVMVATAACSKERDDESAKLGTQTPQYHAEVVNADFGGGIMDPSSGVILVWGTDGVILRSADGLAWAQVPTPHTATISSIASDSVSGVMVAVGENGSVIRSEDGGRSWQAAASSVTAIELKTVVHHAATKSWVAAGEKGTIIRSEDGGKTWSSLGSNVSLAITALYVEPLRGNILLGGEMGLIGSSRDGGREWFITQMPIDSPIVGFAVHDNAIIARSAVGRILSSVDGASTWSMEQTASKSFWTDSAFDPAHKTIVVTGHTGDILRSQDGGASWQLVPITIDGQSKYLSSVFYDDKGKALIAIGHHGAAVKSVDGGKQWTPLGAHGTSSIEAVIHDPKRRLLVGVGKRGLVRVSGDGWQTATNARPAIDEYLREVAVTADRSAFIAAGGVGAIARSTDDGKIWQQIDARYPNPNTPPTIRALVVEPQTESLIAAGPTGIITRSTDSGKTWQTAHHTPFEDNEAFTDLLVDRVGKSLVAIEAYGRNYVSQDGGATWRQQKIDAPGELWHGAIFKNKSLMIATGGQGVIVRSQYGGTRWEVVSSGVSTDLYGAYADDRRDALFVMGDGGVILRSRDGRRWEPVVSNTDKTLRRMVSDPKTGALIAFGQHGAIVRSSDGQNWQAVNSGVQGELRAALVEPGSNNLVLVGQGGAILRSEDGGQTWQRINSHTNLAFRSAAFDPLTGTLVAVGERVVRLTRHAERTASDTDATKH